MALSSGVVEVSTSVPEVFSALTVGMVAAAAVSQAHNGNF
jgi:hypothetical protein